jgi:hypothetical protein
VISFLAGIISRASGPLLVYVLLGLIASNALTGWLLKRAYDANVRAVLVCENQALKDANAAKEAVAARLAKAQQDLREAREQRKKAGEEAEKEIEKRIAEKEIEHAEAIAAMEVATNEIPDEDFFCATEPVSVDILSGMRDAATSYNETRNSRN